MSSFLEKLRTLKVVPVLVLDDAEAAQPVADALVDGGIPVVEVTFRTPAGRHALAAISARTDLLVGAGTILNAEQVDQACDAGASFLVSPGLSADVVRRANERGVPVLPGAATATEIQAAVGLGLAVVKLFPAGQLGGRTMIDALAGPFPNQQFVPSGGVNLANAADYLAHPNVAAVSGSWMVPREAIRAGDWVGIRQLCRETMEALHD